MFAKLSRNVITPFHFFRTLSTQSKSNQTQTLAPQLESTKPVVGTSRLHGRESETLQWTMKDETIRAIRCTGWKLDIDNLGWFSIQGKIQNISDVPSHALKYLRVYYSIARKDGPVICAIGSACGGATSPSDHFQSGLWNIVKKGDSAMELTSPIGKCALLADNFAKLKSGEVVVKGINFEVKDGAQPDIKNVYEESNKPSFK